MVLAEPSSFPRAPQILLQLIMMTSAATQPCQGTSLHSSGTACSTNFLLLKAVSQVLCPHKATAPTLDQSIRSMRTCPPICSKGVHQQGHLSGGSHTSVLDQKVLISAPVCGCGRAAVCCGPKPLVCSSLRRDRRGARGASMSCISAGALPCRIFLGVGAPPPDCLAGSTADGEPLRGLGSLAPPAPPPWHAQAREAPTLPLPLPLLVLPLLPLPCAPQ